LLLGQVLFFASASKKLLEFLNGQPRSLHMDHAVTVRAKQRKVFEPSFATGHKSVDRLDVVRSLS
jgi:hypothetical protein